MEASEQRYGGQWTLDQLADLAAGTGSWPDRLRTPVRKLAAEKSFPDLIAAARERDQLRNALRFSTTGYIRLIEQTNEALGLDPDDDTTCVPGCTDGPQGSEHSLWHLVQQRDQLRATVERVREIHAAVDAVDYAPRNPRVTHVCAGCGQDDGNWQYWPCPTIRALEAGR